mmetsp:Transcript_253/g.697  ORF Transcript_253/g.697 Transcript_253/m.697 type:complete len:258 (-) Transcript_253:1665-2438(-)
MFCRVGARKDITRVLCIKQHVLTIIANLLCCHCCCRILLWSIPSPLHLCRLAHERKFQWLKCTPLAPLNCLFTVDSLELRFLIHMAAAFDTEAQPPNTKFARLGEICRVLVSQRTHTCCHAIRVEALVGVPHPQPRAALSVGVATGLVPILRAFGGRIHIFAGGKFGCVTWGGCVVPRRVTLELEAQLLPAASVFFHNGLELEHLSRDDARVAVYVSEARQIPLKALARHILHRVLNARHIQRGLFVGSVLLEGGEC